MSAVTLENIEQAYQLLAPVVHRSALDLSHTFSQMVGQPIYLKLENLQKTGSFKIRGAYNKIQSLTDAEQRAGGIAASAGNHAQGVAYAAGVAGISATIVMPEGAPLAKVMATRGYGARVILSGSCYDEAYQAAKKLQQEQGLTFIHAFDDAQVIAGQGTIGLEILEQLPQVKNIVIPIGGGGLAAGIVTAIKARAPHVKVIGVEAKGAAAMYLSWQQHSLQVTAAAATMADGIAVKVPGEITFPIINQLIDDIVLVDDEDIASTILMLLERSKQLVEGAGAISLAAVLTTAAAVTGETACIISGGNIDVNFIARIIERGLVKAGRRIKISARIADRPGALQDLLALVARLKANVIHVLHDRLERQVPIGQAVIEISLETRDVDHTEAMLALLRQQGYQVRLL